MDDKLLEPKHKTSIDDLLQNGWQEHEVKELKVFVKKEQTLLYDVKKQRIYSIYRDMYEPMDDR